MKKAFNYLTAQAADHFYIVHFQFFSDDKH